MQHFWHVNGNEIVRDPGLARLRRYLPVLAVIGAPYAGASGDYDPVNPLDPVAEWDALVAALNAVPDHQRGLRVPLALARLLPPTAAHLRETLAHGGADAFRVVHLVASGEGGMISLEDDHGREHLLSPETFAKLFADSSVQVVLLDGCFSPEIADVLLDRSPVQAVIGTRRRLPPPNAAAFSAHLYAALGDGQDIREAFRFAVRALDRMPGGGADRYELLAEGADYQTLTVALPDAKTRAQHALLVGGMPPTVTLPDPLPFTAGFIGRREELGALAGALPDTPDMLVIGGATGVGKSWLAAMVAERFGWRFPDGVVWVTCDPQTSVHTIAPCIARLIDRPHDEPLDALMAALERRRVLVVLDDVDLIAVREYAEQLVQFAREISAHTDSRTIATAREVGGVLDVVPDDCVLWLDRFDLRMARTLAMRLAVERGLDVLDVDTIDDFMDYAQGVPWLIAAGVRWIEGHGIAAALRALDTFPASESDPLLAHITLQVEALKQDDHGALRLLRRAAGLPDAFDQRLAHGLGGNGAQQMIDTLIDYGLLVWDDDFFALPPLVQAHVAAHLPLEPQHRAQVDRVIMTYLTHIWPTDAPVQGALTRTDWARLNNARALLRRYSIEQRGGDARVMAHLIAAAAETFRAAGLAYECADYAQIALGRLPQNNNDPDRVRLQIAYATCAAGDEARMVFEHLLALPDLDRTLKAEAGTAYGRALVDSAHHGDAVTVFREAWQALRSQARPDMRLAAALLHGWARALGGIGQDRDAVKRYREALQAYARLEQPGKAAVALRELGEIVARNARDSVDTLNRAEDLLRRALGSAEQSADRLLVARIRAGLARLHIRRADLLSGSPDRLPELDTAAQLLLAARVDCLVSGCDRELLAAILDDHGDVGARQNAVVDAADDAARSAAYYARLGHEVARADALVQLGRYAMANGNSVAAQDALHEAFETAVRLGLDDVQTLAAGVLLRVHHIRTRHALRGNSDFAAYTRLKAEETRRLLGYHGFERHAAALDQMIAALA